MKSAESISGRETKFTKVYTFNKVKSTPIIIGSDLQGSFSTIKSCFSVWNWSIAALIIICVTQIAICAAVIAIGVTQIVICAAAIVICVTQIAICAAVIVIGATQIAICAAAIVICVTQIAICAAAIVICVTQITIAAAIMIFQAKHIRFQHESYIKIV